MSLTNFNKDIAKYMKSLNVKYDSSVAMFERKLVKEYSSLLTKIQSQIQNLYSEYNNEPKYYKLVELNRLRKIELNLAKEIISISKTSVNTTNEALEKLLTDNYSSLSSSINLYSKKHLSIDLGLTTLDKATINASLINPMDKIGWPNRMSQHASVLNSDIRSTITQGLIRGDSYQNMSKNIVDRFNVAVNKSIRIVRTEAHRIQSTSNLLVLENLQSSAIEEGYEFSKVWLATLDDRTRDSHAYLDGQEADENGLFEFETGGTTEGPGLSGIAEEDINCRCTTIMQLGTLKPSTRFNNQNKVNIPFNTFNKLNEKEFLVT